MGVWKRRCSVMCCIDPGKDVLGRLNGVQIKQVE